MKSFLLVLLGIVIGGVAGFFGGGAVGLGAGAGVGIATGLQAGACLTLEAAREQGLVTEDQEAGILSAAAQAFASDDLPDGPDTSEINCADVVAKIRSAHAETSE